MDNSSKKALNLLSTLKAAVDENNVKKWAAKSASQRYKQEIEKLNTQMDAIIKVDNKIIEHRLKELTLQRETLEHVTRTLKQSLHINTDSLTLLKAHQACVNDKLKMRKERGNKILDDHMKHYERCKEKLARTNPTYKILAEKKAHLKRIQFNIKNFENELNEIEWRKNYKFNIRQKLFYEDYISLATAWLNKRDYDEGVKKIEENGNTLKQLLKDLMELIVKTKEKKKINMNKKTVQNKQATNNALQKLMFSNPSPSKNVLSQRNFPRPPAYFLNYGLVQQNNSFAPPKPSFNTSIIKNKQSCASKSSEKIKILEDKLISVTKKDSVTSEIDTMTKEEKKQAVQAKMQKCIENIKARRSFRRKSSQNLHVEKKEEVLENKNEAERVIKKIPSQPSNEMTQNDQPESGAFQELENLNVSSQEANIMNMFSQESGKNVETNLNNTFKYDPEPKETVNEKNNFEKQTETYDNSSQGKVTSSIKDAKTNVEESLARKMNFPGTPGPVNFPDKLSGLRNEMNLKNQQLKDFNEKTSNNKTPNKTVPSDYFKAPNEKFGRTATGPKTAIQENNLNVQNEKNSASNNFNENLSFGNNIQKSIENQNFQMNMPFSMRQSSKTAIQENKFNVQNEKNSTINNFNEYPTFGNNAQILTENQNFQMNMPFSIGGSTSGYKTQSDSCAFDESVTFKKPKLDNRPEYNKTDLDKQGTSMIKNNIGSQNTENMTKPNDIPYSFGNITQFMDTSIGELGELNSSYDVISPDFNSSLMKTSDQSQNPGMGGLSFLGTGFEFGQPTDAFTFNFN